MSKGPIFAGWIPTVLGNLSFKVLGHNHDPFPTKANLLDTGSTLALFCAQRRTVPDYGFLHPLVFMRSARGGVDALLARWRHGEESEHIYIFLGSSRFASSRRSYQILIGRVYILGVDASPQRAANAATFAGPAGFFGALRQRRHLARMWRMLDRILLFRRWNHRLLRRIIQKFNKRHRDLRIVIRAEANVWITRNGFVFIRPESSAALGRDHDTGHAAARDAEEVARQTFFFLKDAFHKHKHHDPDEERWVDIVNVRAFDGTVNRGWKDEILSGFIRRFIQMSPRPDPRMRGVAEYIETLVRIIDHRGLRRSHTETLAGRIIRPEGLGKSSAHYAAERAFRQNREG